MTNTNELRKAAQAVIDVLGNDGPIFYNYGYDGIKAVEALRQALASPEPSVDALIAEIDGLSPAHVNDEYGCTHSDTLIMYHACDINAILDKHRSVK